MSEAAHVLTQAPAMQATPMQELQQARVAPWVLGVRGSLSTEGAAALNATRLDAQKYV